MTNPLTELTRIENQMLQEHLPNNRLFEKEVLKEFGFIVATHYYQLNQTQTCTWDTQTCT